MKSDKRPIADSVSAYAGHYKVIAPLIMSKGVGDGKTTACVMAQTATIDALRRGETLDEPTDEMDCACRVLRCLAIRLNDTDWWKSNEERTELLRPLIPLLLDSKGSDALTNRRAFYVADQAVRVLTPMRLQWISKNTKNAKLKTENAAGIKALLELAPIVDKASALAASEVCYKLRASADAYASADASADASASAYADAYAYAYAYAYADAYAYAYAYAYADAYAYAYAQKLKYRAALLQVFYDCAAMK